MTSSNNIFQPGENCWVESQARFSTPLIDCANYYKALHSAIVKASHSIFIVGWDIDSRIRLLRGKDEQQSEAPSVISDLLKWKAEQNPDIKIYLLRWDSSLAFFAQREMWAKEVWEEKTPDNVETVLDDTIPMGGSQHQKIVVIDDELVFSGGMDVSTNRWDTRDHPVISEERDGPDGEYGPLHDVQMVSSGPVVVDFAKLVRWRWQRVADSSPIDIREEAQNGEDAPLPEAWPDDYPPLFENVQCALARTIPFMDEVKPAQEVRHMLLDLIREAESVIYIENQFTTRQEIAETLNKQLKLKPELSVIIVSSYEPKGKFECEAFWASRIEFKAILEKGIDANRVKLTYSSIEDMQGRKAYKRIHSKVMTIDDKYLVIGSSNLSNRSMTLDTEIDTVLYGNTPQNKEKIAQVRNDLLAEHTGRALDDMPALFESEHPVEALMHNQIAHGYVLTEVRDEVFTEHSVKNVFRALSDPEEPLISVPTLDGAALPARNPRRRSIMIMIGVTIVAVLGGLMFWASQSIEWLSSDSINAFLEKSRGTYFALPTVLLVYVIGGILFFPVTVLSLAVAAIFGPIWGPIYGIMGALLSSAILFGIGKVSGNAGLRKIGGPKVAAVDEKLKRSGIVGVAAIRMLPVAPFSLVNLVAGISSIGIIQFLIGTFLGMFPPMIAKGLVGDSIAQIWQNPSVETISYLAGGIVLWGLMIWGSQKFARYYQSRKAPSAVDESQDSCSKDEGEKCAA
ncbi:phospholipase [Alteromonas sp. KC3]|uniref:VTT domain-containing protein n=1 Tax=unclassified Alteromonas TaxID=2614992 RepID=UPI0019207AB9|nr:MULTISPECIES: VTT domain-containing protein [unclassified Alteromonas]BCO20391.1 phospholipase [Alteromonas sp. KC3]BCO24357.1 phospholipase [Alteromonas sp. KC14]